MPDPTYQVADLVNMGSLKNALEKSRGYSEYYTDKQAFTGIRFEDSRLKFYTQEELDKEVTAADVEADPEKEVYAPVPAAIVDLPREQFLDELTFENSFNFATWNSNGDEPETFKIAHDDEEGYGDYETAYGMAADEEDDDDRSKDTSDLDGKPVLILKVVTQEIDIDGTSGISTSVYYTFVDLSTLMPFQTATNAEVADMLDEVFPELA